MIKKPLFLVTLCIAGLVQASDHAENRQFLKEQLQMDRQRFKSLQAPDFLQQGAVAPTDRSFIESQARQLQQSMQPEKAQAETALVFVSFSMPPDELKQRVRDAAALGIPVVLRGMVKGDMRATANAVAGLVKESNAGGVQIDPTTFRRYGVTSVPVLIVTCGEGGTAGDRLQGDVTLRQGLKRVAEEGDCADAAQRLLDGEGKP